MENIDKSEGIIRNIAVLHAHNTYNNGSFAMLINLLHYMDRNLPDSTSIVAWIELDGADNEQRLQAALKNQISGKVRIRNLPLKITSPDNSRLIKKMNRLFNKLFVHPAYMKKMEIAAVIILGGDDISEYYKKWMVISDLIRIRIYSLKFVTLLAGQTIGPFKGLRARLAAWCLARTYIYSRDNITFEYLLNKLRFGNEKLVESVDLAFADLPGQHDKFTFNHQELFHNEYVCFIPGGFFALYTGDKEAYIHCWRKLVEDYISTGKPGRKKIVFIPHVTRPEDDRDIISELKNHFSGSDILFIEEELFPAELRQLIGRSYLTVSSRMHASISAFQMGVPALSIGFSVKYQGVIGQVLHCPELIIDSSKELFEDPHIFAETVLDKIGYIQSNHALLMEKINGLIPDLKRRAVDQVKSITEMIIS